MVDRKGRLGNADGTLDKRFRENKGSSKQDRNKGYVDL